MHIILVLKNCQNFYSHYWEKTLQKMKPLSSWHLFLVIVSAFSYCWNFKINYSINLNKVIFSLSFSLENGIYNLWERDLQNTFNHLFSIYSRYFLKPWSISLALNLNPYSWIATTLIYVIIITSMLTECPEKIWKRE